mgnify:CR=1 FL=1
MASVVVIGVGNPDRGDDAAGREVVRRLSADAAKNVRFIEADGEASNLLAYLDGASTAFLVDACVSGAPAGTVRRIDLAKEGLPRARYGLSSHGLGLAEALELAQALGQLAEKALARRKAVVVRHDEHAQERLLVPAHEARAAHGLGVQIQRREGGAPRTALDLSDPQQGGKQCQNLIRLGDGRFQRGAMLFPRATVGTGALQPVSRISFSLERA